jgi:hypothetical protein
MNGTVCTCNMAEALYLLRCANRVVRVESACTWPYGFEECAVVFEGESAEEDHRLYVARRIEVDLRELPRLFAAITEAIVKGGAA